jgi:Uma2 family endonuclease
MATAIPAGAPVPPPVRWTCDDFHDVCDAGVFEGRNVILVDGELLEMPAPNPPHNTAVSLADYLFKSIFQTGFVVRVQMGLELGQTTDPVPDLAVVPGDVRTFATVQPTTAVLVVEVSDSTLAYDIGDKANLYAAGGIADYWVIDVAHDLLQVFRDPRPDPGQPHGHSYFHQTTLGRIGSIAPLAAPTRVVSVNDLLP